MPNSASPAASRSDPGSAVAAQQQIRDENQPEHQRRRELRVPLPPHAPGPPRPQRTRRQSDQPEDARRAPRQPPPRVGRRGAASRERRCSQCRRRMWTGTSRTTTARGSRKSSARAPSSTRTAPGRWPRVRRQTEGPRRRRPTGNSFLTAYAPSLITASNVHRASVMNTTSKQTSIAPHARATPIRLGLKQGGRAAHAGDDHRYGDRIQARSAAAHPGSDCAAASRRTSYRRQRSRRCRARTSAANISG